MNLIKTLTARIEDYRLTNKQPCKNYATEAAAEKATAAMATAAAKQFTYGVPLEPAQYVVFYIESWGRWVGCIGLSELHNRPTYQGGYLGFCTGFFTY